MAAFIAVYWGVRLTLQFVWFRGVESPAGMRFRLAEIALVTLFVALTLIYGAAAWLGGGAAGR